MATVSQVRARSRSKPARESEGPALIDDILTMAGSLANTRKAYAATQLESLAASVRQFSDTMPSVPTIKAYATAAADSLEDLANYVVESDLNDMAADAREFSRRHPLATLGGSIAAGLVITQLFQARAQSLRSGVSARRREVALRGRSSGRSSRSGRGSGDKTQDQSK